MCADLHHIHTVDAARNSPVSIILAPLPISALRTQTFVTKGTHYQCLFGRFSTQLMEFLLLVTRLLKSTVSVGIPADIGVASAKISFLYQQGIVMDGMQQEPFTS